MAYKFNLKRPDQEESALMIRFSKNGVPFKFYSGKTIPKKYWDDKEQKVTSKLENYKLINRYLENYQYELGVIIDRFEAQKMRLDQDAIKEELDKIFNKAKVEAKKETDCDFISFYDSFIESHKHYKASTISILKQNRKHVICAMQLITKAELKEYNNLSTKKRGLIDLKPNKKLPFEQINEQFLEKFIQYLRTAKFTITVRGVEVEQNYKKNYIGKHTKQIKQVIRAAFKKGVARFDMEDYKASFEEVDTVFSDFEELQYFVDLHLEGREKKVRDAYVLNCFLGMRFSDLSEIARHLFEERMIDEQKHVIYTGRQIKTDNRVEFPVHQNAVRILEEYTYQMSDVSEAEFNKLIKVVAEKAGITQLFRKRETRGQDETTFIDIEKCYVMSSHTGRRSFCTNYYNAGWPIGAIMAISGHKTEEEFLKYVKAGVSLKVLVKHQATIPELKVKKAA